MDSNALQVTAFNANLFREGEIYLWWVPYGMDGGRGRAAVG